jgi:hypothetical protein
VKLSTRGDGTRDGELVVVSHDLARCVAVPEIARTLQAALDDWSLAAPSLAAIATELDAGRLPDATPFEPQRAMAPLPRAYQWVEGSARTVQSAYRIEGEHQIGFEVGTFDPSLPLVIDPVLTYSTYLGGGEDDRGLSIAVDIEGNTYVAGVTQSANFPQATISAGAGGDDLFITKLNPAGNTLIYSTYLGGSADELGRALAVDDAGNLYRGEIDHDRWPLQPAACEVEVNTLGDWLGIEMKGQPATLHFAKSLEVRAWSVERT